MINTRLNTFKNLKQQANCEGGMMAEKKKRMISVTFTGKELLSNGVFDTNDEKVAKQYNVHEQGKTYKPLTILTGENELLPLVEKELETMTEGEERIVKMIAKDAFGERRNELLRVVPLQNFHEQKINPFPGLVVRIGNAMGRVQSVGSGRVRIDFNHPLAGRDVEYSIRLEKEFKDKKEIAEQMYEKYYSRIPGTKKEFNEDTLTITLEGNAFKNLTKVNEAITDIAKQFNLKLDFKESEALPELVHEHTHTGAGDHQGHSHSHEGHVHGPECNHDHDNHEHAHSHSHSAAGEEEEEHVHGPNCNHTHAGAGNHSEEEEAEEEQEKPVNIHKLADTLSKNKKSNVQFDTTKDTASTIQRPKKKNY